MGVKVRFLVRWSAFDPNDNNEYTYEPGHETVVEEKYASWLFKTKKAEPIGKRGPGRPRKQYA